MGRGRQGPRRSKSVDAFQRGSRIVGAVALLALAGGIASDFAAASFWSRHPVLTGVVSSLLVVMLSGAVLNEAFERRRRARWSVLAQYVMLELVRNARLIWTGVLELVGTLPRDPTPDQIADAGVTIVRDRSRLAAAVAPLVGDLDRRESLCDEIVGYAAHSDEVLGRWASVMLNAAMYAELVDRHVELASQLAWLGGLLDGAHPPDDRRRHRRARASPSFSIEGSISGDLLVDRLVVITRLAEQLDRGTLDVALRIVPLTWWERRMAAVAPAKPRPR